MANNHTPRTDHPRQISRSYLRPVAGVEICVGHNNISGIRTDSNNSAGEHCLIRNDEQTLSSRNGTLNQRGIWIRSEAENMGGADCTIVQTANSGVPIRIVATTGRLSVDAMVERSAQTHPLEVF